MAAVCAKRSIFVKNFTGLWQILNAHQQLFKLNLIQILKKKDEDILTILKGVFEELEGIYSSAYTYVL